MITIATTGDKFSQDESETAIISAKSVDNTTLTLNKSLQFDHLSENRIVGSGINKFTLKVQAEVGLLSRNVIFQGYNDNSWTHLMSAPSCPTGFLLFYFNLKMQTINLYKFKQMK